MPQVSKQKKGNPDSFEASYRIVEEFYFTKTFIDFSPILTIAVEPVWSEVFMVAKPLVAIAKPCFVPLTL